MDIEMIHDAPYASRFDGTPAQLQLSREMLSQIFSEKALSLVSVGDTLEVQGSEASSRLVHIQKSTGEERTITRRKARNTSVLCPCAIPFLVRDIRTVSSNAPILAPDIKNESFDVVVVSQGTSRWIITKGREDERVFVAEIVEGHSRISDEEEYRPRNIHFLDFVSAVEVRGKRVIENNLPYSLLVAVRTMPASLAA